MHFAKRRPSHFDARSVLLFTALAFGSAAALHAQTAANHNPQPGFGPAPAATQAASNAAPQKSTVGPATKAGAAFAKADTNQDGKLSATEAATVPAIGKHFAQIDSDHDGFLSPEEFHQGAQR